MMNEVLDNLLLDKFMEDSIVKILVVISQQESNIRHIVINNCYIILYSSKLKDVII